MLATYALLLASTLAPAETDAADLAGALAAQHGGQAVVALVDGRTVSIDKSSTGEALSLELKKRNVRFIPGPVAVAHTEILPDAAMRNVARLREPDPTKKPNPIALPAEALTGGKVTYTSASGSTVDLGSLTKITWSQPLVLSSAFTNGLAATDLAVSVKDLDETEFLRSVAKAIGGRFRTDGKSLRIETNGSELRARALRSIELTSRNLRKGGENEMNLAEAQSEDVSDVPLPGRGNRRGRSPAASTPAAVAAQLDLARAVTNGVTGQNFEKWLDGELPALSIDLAGQAAAQNALVRLLRANAVEPPEVARVNRLLATVPPRAPGSIVLGDGYSLDATLNTLDRRGNAGRTVRLKAL